MPNTKSAQKRLQQNEDRRLRNRGGEVRDQDSVAQDPRVRGSGKSRKGRTGIPRGSAEAGPGWTKERDPPEQSQPHQVPPAKDDQIGQTGQTRRLNWTLKRGSVFIDAHSPADARSVEDRPLNARSSIVPSSATVRHAHDAGETDANPTGHWRFQRDIARRMRGGGHLGDGLHHGLRTAAQDSAGRRRVAQSTRSTS